ncbi:MAG TPA: hypothetical protein VHF25_08000 [Nitriliruptorales bacterium]|nr:hypothetical protein [Nitriliruptorales bacterium]
MSWRTRTVSAAVGGTALVAGAAGWRFAERVLEPQRHADALDDQGCEGTVDVVRAETTSVTLRGPRAAVPGRWGLAWPGGYLQVGAPTAITGDAVTRPVLRRFQGTLAAGATAVLDSHAYPPDPGVLGLPWREVTYHSPAGGFAAWEIGPRAGRSADAWAVVVHGRGGRRTEGLRLVPALAEAGLTSLVISYRNDRGAPASPDGLCHLGHSEWQEVEGAVVYALAHGARRVLLVGSSMGGTAVLTFLRASAHSDAVCGSVLDAPVLHWPSVLRRGAAEAGVLPALLPLLLPATLAVARVRAGIDWRALDHRTHVGPLRPVLLIHGADDDRVPVGPSDAFARQRPHLVRYVRVPGAGHIQSWNVDPEGVERELRAFVASLQRERRWSRGRARLPAGRRS